MTTDKTPDDLTVEQFYTAHDGTVWPEETWVTEDGRKILVKDLSADHARNIVRMIIRNDRILNEQHKQMLAALEAVFAQAEREETGQLLN
jgi:hypothetical protein